MPQTFKILSYNAGHCSGLNGSVPQYLAYGHRHLRTSPRVKHKVMAAIRDVLKEEAPDLCCLMEIDNYALTQVQATLPKQYAHFHSENKYGETSILRKVPNFAKRSTGFLSKTDLDFTKHYLKAGMKKLLYEFTIAPDLHVFLGHFALKEATRHKQFEELKEILRTKERVVICGDFNIFKGFDELQSLVSHYDLRILNSEGDKTFPSFRPRKSLDLFICSKDVNVKDFRILKDLKASDHLPVLLELEV